MTFDVLSFIFGAVSAIAFLVGAVVVGGIVTAYRSSHSRRKVPGDG